jgi:hypothetical protein
MVMRQFRLSFGWENMWPSMVRSDKKKKEGRLSFKALGQNTPNKEDKRYKHVISEK